MRRIISVLIENESGALSRVVGLFSQRGYNIESLTVSPTNDNTLSRMTITTDVQSNAHLEQMMKQLHKLIDVLRVTELTEGAHIERFYYCPFHPEGAVAEFRKVSSCRKPAPGMLLQAAADYDIDLSRSYMMGDNWMDIAAGLDAGCRTVLVLTGKNPARRLLAERNLEPHLVTENILTAIQELRAAL